MAMGALEWRFRAADYHRELPPNSAETAREIGLCRVREQGLLRRHQFARLPNSASEPVQAVVLAYETGLVALGVRPLSQRDGPGRTTPRDRLSSRCCLSLVPGNGMLVVDCCLGYVFKQIYQLCIHSLFFVS